MHMADWIAKLDDFLRLSGRDILTHAGKISHQLAHEHAHAQFARYDHQRRELEAREPAGDFDKAVKRIIGPPPTPTRGKNKPKRPKASEGPGG